MNNSFVDNEYSRYRAGKELAYDRIEGMNNNFDVFNAQDHFNKVNRRSS